MPPTAALIRVEQLSHVYLRGTPLEVRSLQRIDLEVCASEVVGVAGPTGSGKSTLLQHLNGLFRPQQGEVYVNDLPLSNSETDIRNVRQRIGLLFQNPEDQLFERYAGDDVAFAPRSQGLPPTIVRARVRKAMEEVGLPFALKDRLTAELSQGQRRRLALAGVLAMDPQVLVLDEPTAGLDPQGRRNLLSTLQSWVRSPNRAMVLATHNMEDIATLCSKMVVLVDGQVVEQGSPRTIFGAPGGLRQYGLSVPVAVQVMVNLRERGHDAPGDVLTLEEAASAIVSHIHA